MKKSDAVILAIDAGTGDCRAIAFSAEGAVLAFAHTEWTYDQAVAGIPDAYAFQPEACFESICGLIRRVAQQLGTRRVEAVTVTSQRDGMAFLDSSGRELYCAPNMDLRGKAVLGELEQHQKEILQETGLPLHAMFGLPRLLWHKRYAPETYARIERVLMLCDWLAYRLSGQIRSERAAAGSSQMLSIGRGVYSGELMDRLGLRNDIFPPVCASDEVIGALLPGVAAKTGLSAGTPVLIGGSDTHCGVIGMGLLHAGETAVVAGTTTPVIALCDAPLIDPNGGVYAGCSSVAGLWALESNAGSTGLSFRWVRDLLCGPAEDAFSRMAEEAQSIPIGCDGMMAYIGASIPEQAAGKNYGGFLFPVPWNIGDFTRAHFFRAAMETNAFGVCANLTALYGVGAEEPELLHLCGGQSRAPLFCQMLCDITGLPVQTYENPESTALGAALCAAAGVGLYASLSGAASAFVRRDACYWPEERQSAQYQKVYEDWLRLRGHLSIY